MANTKLYIVVAMSLTGIINNVSCYNSVISSIFPKASIPTKPATSVDGISEPYAIKATPFENVRNENSFLETSGIFSYKVPLNPVTKTGETDGSSVRQKLNSDIEEIMEFSDKNLPKKDKETKNKSLRRLPTSSKNPDYEQIRNKNKRSHQQTTSNGVTPNSDAITKNGPKKEHLAKPKKYQEIKPERRQNGGIVNNVTLRSDAQGAGSGHLAHLVSGPSGAYDYPDLNLIAPVPDGVPQLDHHEPVLIDQAYEIDGRHAPPESVVVEGAFPHLIAKPLKPSVVHRDPKDSYHHHDKIRTLDKDIFYNQEVFEGFRPYHYDMKEVPECAYKNKHFYNITFCLDDHQYPVATILWAIAQHEELSGHLFSDVTYQSADNLVTGLTKAVEEGYTYKHYFGDTHAHNDHLDQFKPPYNGYHYKTDYFKKGGYICPSDIYYGRPKRAMNTYGQWKVIVNVDHGASGHLEGHVVTLPGHKKKRDIPSHPLHPRKSFTQTLRLEQCIYQNAPCSYVDANLHSKCIQKHNFVRLVAWTLEEGLHVDTFKMPIACSCHIPQPIHFYQQSGHHHEHHISQA